MRCLCIFTIIIEVRQRPFIFMKHHKAVQHHPRALPNKHVKANNSGTDVHIRTSTHIHTLSLSLSLSLFFYYSFSPTLWILTRLRTFIFWVVKSKTWCWSRRKNKQQYKRLEREKEKGENVGSLPINTDSNQTHELVSSLIPPNLQAVSLHIFHYNLQTLQYLALMGDYNLFAGIERFFRNPHSNLSFGGCEYAPEWPESEARSCRHRLNVKLRWLNGNIDTVVDGYINTVICNWYNLMDCMSVKGFVASILTPSESAANDLW